jgi:hypothetical protein
MSATSRKPLVKRDFILGLDLGQAQDYTALVVLEREARETGEVRTFRPSGSYSFGMGGHLVSAPQARQESITKNYYAARHIERLPLGTAYPEQVRHVQGLFDRLRLTTGETVELAVDQTGVGRAVVDMLREAKLPVTAISITGGDNVTYENGTRRVPKRDLVGTVQVLLQTERLKIDKTLPEASILTAELQGFKYAITAAGHDRYGNDVSEWRENSHDDLVLAAAVAAWWGENQPPPRRRAVRSHTSSVFDW